MEFNEALEKWMKAAQEKRTKEYKASFKIAYGRGYSPIMMAKEGRKHIKIIDTEKGKEKSTYAFIDKKTGDILKPASWRVPAKGARGNIFAEDGGLNCVELFTIQYLK